MDTAAYDDGAEADVSPVAKLEDLQRLLDVQCLCFDGCVIPQVVPQESIGKLEHALPTQLAVATVERLRVASRVPRTRFSKCALGL
jgi:hypothetical protein